MTGQLQRVFCIDDEPDVLAVAQMSLETVGEFTVITASSGKQAVEQVVAAKPDAILLDVMMPEMDGPATLKELRQLPELDSVPIIFMTARVRPNEVDEYMGLGADGVVAKPFDPMELSDQIRAVWERFHGR